jgi:ribose transport system ATP-binding protein
MTEPLLQVSALTKAFGSNKVLRAVDLTVDRGEFVGFMGPNGAGKSTLIKILDGVYQADSGTIAIDGEIVSSLAHRRDVGFVHQDLGVVDALSILDNVRLGRPPLRAFGPLLSAEAETEDVRRALSAVDLDLDLTRPVSTLAPGEKALLAVGRALALGARLLIIDEATSNLPPSEAERFTATLRGLADQGAAVVFVSHKLSEVRKSCRRGVLLLDGAIAADTEIHESDEDQLLRLLTAHERSVTAEAEPENPEAPGPGEVVLAFEEVCASKLGPVSFEVHEREVFGLTGSVGSGLHELAFLAAGTSKPRAGRVSFAGRQRALVPPQREREGSVVDLTVGENLTLSSLPRWRGPLRLLRGGAETSTQDRMIEELNVKPPRRELRQGALSGGNQQKVLFGRALLLEADLYVLCEPTRGVDVATRQELYRLIRRLRDEGAAVLVVTSDAEDLLGVCDRIAVLSDGRVGTHVAREDLTQKEISLIL